MFQENQNVKNRNLIYIKTSPGDCTAPLTYGARLAAFFLVNGGGKERVIPPQRSCDPLGIHKSLFEKALRGDPVAGEILTSFYCAKCNNYWPAVIGTGQTRTCFACMMGSNDELDILYRALARQCSFLAKRYIDAFLSKHENPSFDKPEVAWDWFLMVVGPMREAHPKEFKAMTFYGAYVVDGGYDEWGFFAPSPDLVKLGFTNRHYVMPDGKIGVDVGNDWYANVFWSACPNKDEVPAMFKS